MTKKIIIKSLTRKGNVRPSGILFIKGSLSMEASNRLMHGIKNAVENGGFYVIGGDDIQDVKYFPLR